MKIQQMKFSILIFAVAIISCTSQEQKYPPLIEPVSVLFDDSLKPFYHGVASGDPLHDRVIIWTRVTPSDSLHAIEVVWEISETKEFTSILLSGKVNTSPNEDYTVKADVAGLVPDKFYFYRFKALGATSMIGRTKTSPVEMKDSLSFAVVSCTNWEFGYFNAYARIAEKELDAVMHLGDYIYEYGTGRYGDTTIGRINIPPYEIISLQDYRTRHSQYRLDEGSRLMSMRHPLIAIWDDHEVANDLYAGGAQNHQPEEGEFEIRKKNAKQAYYEWLPIREDEKHYRAISYGQLADLIMLDERLEGRTKQAEGLNDPDLMNETRTMLGQEQYTWFTNQLKNSSASWKVIGNQVIFSALDESFRKNAKGTDNWNGYPVERKRIADFITSNKIKDVVFLTGDTHASWAFEVTLDPNAYKKSAATTFAVEFATPSISSGNWDESYPVDSAKLGEQLYQKFNPHLKYLNGTDHGYTILTLFPDKAKAQWYYVETLRKIDSNERLSKTITVSKGSNTIN